MASLEELRPINRIRAAAERGGGLDASDEEALFAALAPEEAERAAVDAEWRAWHRHPATHQHEADGSVTYCCREHSPERWPLMATPVGRQGW